MKERLVSACIIHGNHFAIGRDCSRVADLTAHLAVERGAGKDEHDRFFFGRGRALGQGRDRLIVRNDPHDGSSRNRQRFVAEEDRIVNFRLQRFDRTGFEKLDAAAGARFLAVLAHRFLVAVPVEREVALSSDRCEKFRREAVRRVHFGRFVAGDLGAVLGLHLIEDALDFAQPVIDRGEEVGLFAANDVLDLLLRFDQFGVLRLHLVHDFRNDFPEERLGESHAAAVQNTAAQQTLHDVLFLVRPGVNVFVDAERAGAHVVGDAAQTAAIIRERLVLDPADFAGGFDDRAQNVDVEVGRHALQSAGAAFQTHSRVDVLAREREQIVEKAVFIDAGRRAFAVELGEHEVPDLHLAQRRVVVDLAARAADAIGAFARGAGGPEVFVFFFAFDLIFGQTDFFVPDVVRFLVGFIDGDAERVLLQAEVLRTGEELPRPVDRFVLEVVAEAEVSEHFKESVVVRGAPHVVDVAGAEALLARRRAGEIELDAAQEVVLELVHSSGGEEDRRVPFRDQNVARTADTAFRFEERKVHFTKFVGFHDLFLEMTKKGKRKYLSILYQIFKKETGPPAN